MEDGVWRTISGRKVFIKEGQSLSDAMKESGKFNKRERRQQYLKDIEEEKFNKLEEKFGEKYKNTQNKDLLKKAEELDEEANGYSSKLTYDEIREAREEIKYLKNEYANRTKAEREEQSRKENTMRIEKEKQESQNRVSKISDNDIKELKRTSLTENETKKWSEDIDVEINRLETPDLYISNGSLESLIDDNKQLANKRANLEALYDNDKINIEQYLKYQESINSYEENIREVIAYQLEKKGYQYEELPGGRMVYSQRVHIQTGYNQMLDYLDRKKVKYEISRSINAGIVPSIYIKDKDGDTIARIGNHANSNMTHLEKTFDNKDYLNWKDKIIKKIDLY